MSGPCIQGPNRPVPGETFSACGGAAWCAEITGNFNECWFGLDFDAETFGQDCRDNYGVGLGCASCDDLPEAWVRGARTDGRRFLMPYTRFSPEAPLHSGKDAHGDMHDLRSNEPWRVPLTITFLRGSVYSDDRGLECVLDACDFARTKANYCVDGRAGFEVPGFLPDERGFTGHHMPDAHGNMYVRHVLKRSEPHVLTFGQNYLFLPNLHRTFDCTSNLLLGCIAAIPPIDGCNCERSWARTFVGESCDVTLQGLPPRPDPGYYDTNPANRVLYNFLRITSNNTHIRGAPRRMFNSDVAPTAVKDAVLNMIATQELPGWIREQGGQQAPVRMDQVNQNSRGTGIALYEGWSRDWNLFGDGSLLAPPSALPMLSIAGGVSARLRHSGVTFAVQPVLLLATIEVAMIAHALRDVNRPGPPYSLRVQPQTRVRISGRWGLRLVDDVDFTTPDGRMITVTQPNIYADPWPIVSGDRVDYRIGSAPLLRFQNVHWEGELSSFSVPRVPDLAVAESALSVTCRFFREAFEAADIRVPGSPTYSDSWPTDPNRNSIYGGSVGLEFPI